MSHCPTAFAPCPWANSRESPVGFQRLSTWPKALTDAYCQQNGEVGGQVGGQRGWVDQGILSRVREKPLYSTTSILQPMEADKHVTIIFGKLRKLNTHSKPIYGCLPHVRARQMAQIKQRWPTCRSVQHQVLKLNYFYKQLMHDY